MSKPFRYFRAELNGFFLRTLVTIPNDAIMPEIDELAYWASCAWPSVVGPGQISMRDSDVYLIGSYLSAFVGALPGHVGPNAVIRFTEEFRSLEDKLRTERGLFNTNTSDFEFQNVEVDDPLGDIVDNATGTLRASFIPEGQPIIGYIPRSAIAYDQIGNIILEEVLSSPPVDEPYIPYYGEKFLVLSDVGTPDPIKMLVRPFTMYVETVQKVRRNGPSIRLLCELTEGMVGDFVKDLYFTSYPGYTTLGYSIAGIDSIDAFLRLELWKLMVRNRFGSVFIL